MSGSGEKRTFARVKTNIKAYVRRLKTGARLPEPFDASIIESKSDVQDLENSGLHEGVVRFLKAMDFKLNMLVSYITHNRLTQEYPETVQVVELSGSGMIFMSSKDFDPNQNLEVVLVLSRYPLEVAAAAGHITRGQSAKSGKLWMMEFTHVRESDLEKIVQFVFSEERELIREKKWGEPPAER